MDARTPAIDPAVLEAEQREREEEAQLVEQVTTGAQLALARVAELEQGQRPILTHVDAGRTARQERISKLRATLKALKAGGFAALVLLAVSTLPAGERGAPAQVASADFPASWAC